jgi:hypothetical protein
MLHELSTKQIIQVNKKIRREGARYIDVPMSLEESDAVAVLDINKAKIGFMSLKEAFKLK